MKKTIGICFFAALFLAGAIFLFLQLESSEAKKPEDMPVAEETEQAVQTEQPESTESMTVQEPYQYVLKDKDGVLVVYEKDGVTVLLETNIKVSTLEAEKQEMLKQGIFVADEQELYDLLESYSS